MQLPEPVEQDYASGLSQIDGHSWFRAVGLIISNETPRGTPIDDDETFEEIDTEMMKRGTLAHTKIRWEWVGDQCRQLMEERSKDYRLLAFMLQSLASRSDTGSALPLAAALFTRFMHLWRDTAFPQGKARIAPIRHLVDCLETMFAKAAEHPLGDEERPVTASALRQASSLIAEISPELGIRLAVLPGRLDKPDKKEEPAEGPSAEPAAPQTAPAIVPLRADSLRLDSSNERALKQSLSVVADYLIGVDVAQPLSYRIRRYATWFGISSPPPLKNGNRTVIQPVSEESADIYRIAAERGHDSAETAQKLERSCLIQPFWIEGQFIAYRLAQASGRGLVADAIRAETAQFVGGFEWMTELQFSDGAKFVSKEVHGWLSGGRAAPENDTRALREGGAGELGPENSLVDQEMRATLLAAREQARQGHMEAALSLMDRARTNMQSPRAAAIWEVLVMECLSDWGMKAHVSAQASRFGEVIADRTVREWEPELMERIGRLQSK